MVNAYMMVMMSGLKYCSNIDHMGYIFSTQNNVTGCKYLTLEFKILISTILCIQIIANTALHSTLTTFFATSSLHKLKFKQIDVTKLTKSIAWINVHWILWWPIPRYFYLFVVSISWNTKKKFLWMRNVEEEIVKYLRCCVCSTVWCLFPFHIFLCSSSSSYCWCKGW